MDAEADEKLMERLVKFAIHMIAKIILDIELK